MSSAVVAVNADEVDDVCDRKRALSESDIVTSPTNRPKLNVTKELRPDYKAQVLNGKARERWYTHGLTEDYVNVVSELLYPKCDFGPYGYDHDSRRFPVERMNSLGWLLSPLRKASVFEKWSPIEVAVFEGAITLFGKNFNMIQKYVKTKTVQEVVEFYYDWKKTSHYKEWKKAFAPDERESPCVYAD